MGYFDGSESTRVNESGGNYLLPGNYRVRIKELKVKETRKAGNAFIADFEVLESDNPEVKAGSTRNWYQSMADRDICFQELFKFYPALLGVVATGKDDATVAFMTNFAKAAPQILEGGISNGGKKFAGKEVCVEVYTKKTKAKGLDFSVHKWTPAPAAVSKAA